MVQVVPEGPVSGSGRVIGGCMRPVKRKLVHKGKSARQFRAKSGRTKMANISTAPMRGGIRL